LVNVPLCLLALSVGVKLLRESRDETAPRTVDYFGAILAVFGVGLLTLMIVQSDEWGWATQRALLVFALALAFLVSFIIRCRVAAHPVLDLKLLKLPFVTAAAISGFGFTMGFFSLIFVNTQWLQTVWNYSPSRSGLAGIPGPVMAAIVAAPAGRLAQRIGHGKVVATGAVILCSGNLFLSYWITDTPNYLTHYLPVMVYTGIGVGLCISTISSSATAFLPQPKFAMGSALNNTARQIGAALGVALVSAILVSALARNDYLNGFHTAWRLTSFIILLSGAAMLTLFRKPTQQQLESAS
jgi:predicted MFS family arabinose efflux permease